MSSSVSTNSEGTLQENPLYQQWISRDQGLLTLINSTLSPTAFSLVVGQTTAHGVWSILEKSVHFSFSIQYPQSENGSTQYQEGNHRFCEYLSCRRSKTQEIVLVQLVFRLITKRFSILFSKDFLMSIMLSVLLYVLEMMLQVLKTFMSCSLQKSSLSRASIDLSKDHLTWQWLPMQIVTMLCFHLKETEDEEEITFNRGEAEILTIRQRRL
jgi:hypothetical protein